MNKRYTKKQIVEAISRFEKQLGQIEESGDPFFSKTRCDRCGGPLSGGRTMSMFNTDVICMKCAAEEKERPDYQEARDAEQRAVKSGDMNFKGIGLREDDSEADSKEDEIMLEDRLTDYAGFDFAVEVKDALRDGKIAVENCTLEQDSIAELKKRAGALQPWKKTFLCGFPVPEAYSLETAAKHYGYDELDAGDAPVDDDERRYVADKNRWYNDFVDNSIWNGMPSKVFGVVLRKDPFLLRAMRPDGEGIGLACRLVSFW